MSDQTSVMVTGVGGGGIGEQILKALRLAETRYEIIGGDISCYSAGLAEVDAPYILPLALDEDYIDVLLAVCERHDVKALFPGSEPELEIMAANRKRIEEAGIFLPINSQDVIDTCIDKVKSAAFLQENAFAAPAFARVRSIEDALAFNMLPSILKPSIGSGGSADVFIVQTPGELSSRTEELLTAHDEFIIQQYVGTPDAEYTIGVLCDMNGNLINSIALRREIMSAMSNRTTKPNRSGDESLGTVLAISSGISQGEIGRFPEVTGECERIALALGVRGAVNIQCRLVDGKVYVFEINPRFSGTTSQRAMVGYNEPDILIRKHVFGEDIEVHFKYGSGVVVRSLKETLLRDQKFSVARDLP